MFELFRKYIIPERIYDISFDGIEVLLKQEEKIYRTKLWYKLFGVSGYYDLYINKKKIPGKYSKPWIDLEFTQYEPNYKRINQEDILRFLDTGNFWPPSKDEFKVYRFGNIAEIILKKPKGFSITSGTRRTVAELVRGSDGYFGSPIPYPGRYDLYINGEKLVTPVYAYEDRRGDIDFYSEFGKRHKLTKEHIQNYLKTGSLW